MTKSTYTIKCLSELALNAIKHHDNKEIVAAYEDADFQNDLVRKEVFEALMSGTVDFVTINLSRGSWQSITRSSQTEGALQTTFWLKGMANCHEDAFTYEDICKTSGTYVGKKF